MADGDGLGDVSATAVPVFLVVDLVDASLEDLLLVGTEQLNELLSAVPMDGACLCDVVAHRRQEVLVKLNESVKTTLSNIECTERWQEIVSNEEAEEDEVVNDAFNVEAEAQLAI